MKDLRDLKDLTIHDVQPIRDELGFRVTCGEVAFRRLQLREALMHLIQKGFNLKPFW